FTESCDFLAGTLEVTGKVLTFFDRGLEMVGKFGQRQFSDVHAPAVCRSESESSSSVRNRRTLLICQRVFFRAGKAAAVNGSSTLWMLDPRRSVKFLMHRIE